MTFYEMIEDLSFALKREKLVIFVGAGVSKNSGLPTWGQIVHAFAKEIGYPTKGRLATEEYIRIPQYYYCLDKKRKPCFLLLPDKIHDTGKYPAQSVR